MYGEIEYYAALKASEIDPIKVEMIGAFIIEDDQQKLIKQQIDCLRKSLSNGKKSQQDQRSNNSVVCTASDNYNKLNSVEKDINQIHEKLESLIKMNTAKGLKSLLRKQLESIISEAEIKSKQEAIQHLIKAQYDLQQEQQKIQEQILELSKVNLLDTTYEQLSILMKQAGSNITQINASWKAVEYWRKSEQELTWDNLEKSTVNKSKDKIYGFASGSFQTLKKVAYL